MAKSRFSVTASTCWFSSRSLNSSCSARSINSFAFSASSIESITRPAACDALKAFRNASVTPGLSLLLLLLLSGLSLAFPPNPCDTADATATVVVVVLRKKGIATLSRICDTAGTAFSRRSLAYFWAFSDQASMRSVRSYLSLVLESPKTRQAREISPKSGTC